MSSFREQLFLQLDSERTLEGFVGRLSPREVQALVPSLLPQLPEVDAVICLLGAGQGFAFALALELGARLIVAQDRPFRFDGVYASEVDDRILFALQHHLHGTGRVLVAQDFLRRGYTPLGLVGLAVQASAQVVGYASLVEYTNLGGRNRLEMMNLSVQSLAQVAHTPRGLQPERRTLP